MQYLNYGLLGCNLIFVDIIGCKVTPEGYGHMTHLLSSLANGRVILALEGGYNLTSIAYSMVMCTKALLGDPLPPLSLSDEIHPGALHSIQNVLDVQAKFWTVLKPFRKYLPSVRNLIPVGDYELLSLEEKMSSLQVKDDSNGNERESGSSTSRSSMTSVDLNSSGGAAGSVCSPEGSTPDTMVVKMNIDSEGAAGGQNLEELGACGGTATDSLKLSDLMSIMNSDVSCCWTENEYKS
jgi:hypothetical protein